MSQHETEVLSRYVSEAYNCRARHERTVPVEERFQKDAFWKVDVHVFRLQGCSQGTTAYGWFQPVDDGPEHAEPVTILGSVHVRDARQAVQTVIARLVDEASD